MIRNFRKTNRHLKLEKFLNKNDYAMIQRFDVLTYENIHHFKKYGKDCSVLQYLELYSLYSILEIRNSLPLYFLMRPFQWRDYISIKICNMFQNVQNFLSHLYGAQKIIFFSHGFEIMFLGHV